MEYAIIDIETSGGTPKDSKVIEIAIIITDGTTVLDTYQTLVNPEKSIDWYVTKLTGITNKDVANAPKFYEVAKTIYQLIENRVFVAHNIGFDYPIVRNEFKSLGLDIRLPHLCTIQTARVLIPDVESYGLKNLSNHLDIKLDSHHRAMADTEATAEIFSKLYRIVDGKLDHFIKQDINPKLLHEKLDLATFDDIPNKTGVYFFYNDKGELIYIGKSIHIKKRVEQHLKNTKTDKAIQMRSEIAKIEYQLTGSELISLLKESELIKKYQPPYNRAQRNTNFSYGIYTYVDGKGYINLTIKKVNATEQPVHTFTSIAAAKSQLESWVETYDLCEKLVGLFSSTGACFKYTIKNCAGACAGKESAETYNKKVQQLIDKLTFSKKSFIITDKGKSKTEISFVYIEKGQYKGYGFAPGFVLKKNKMLFKKYLKIQTSNRDFKSIINMQLAKNTKLEVLEF
ncbi:MAG: exonuclease domain-containing protein [Putridiphycobacter sp.]|nr:exonuclease domain-containing protein [Putridiphycobacter sp.]